MARQTRPDAAPGWRRAGVLLHLTSLPGPDGIGDLGAPSKNFIEWLARAGQRIWQLLPLPPANAVQHPYDASCGFAGNPLLLCLDDFVASGLLPDTLPAIRTSMGAAGDSGAGTVAGQPRGEDPLARVARWKLPLVRQAARQLLSLPPSHELTRGFLQFCEREAWWLADHVAFTALREQYPAVARAEWPREDRVRRLGAHRARSLDIGATHQHPEAAVQFLFDQQLRRLRDHARLHDVWLMGDTPIYVGDDSADVWAHPELFMLDDEQRPRVCTGTPPDAIDPGGQVWPMPAYDWAAHAASEYEWWLRRLRRQFSMADVVRLDHFRGFADWWSVPPRAAYGEQGRWESGPGATFFEAVTQALGEVEMVVEDLGPRTQALERLSAETDLPPTRVLVHGFGEGGASTHLPTAWTGNEAAYTANHNFDTVRGWANAALDTARAEPSDDCLAFALRFTGAGGLVELPRASIESVMRSPARYAMVPLQDWLGLGSERRWSAPEQAFDDELASELLATARRAGRTGAG